MHNPPFEHGGVLLPLEIVLKTVSNILSRTYLANRALGVRATACSSSTLEEKKGIGDGAEALRQRDGRRKWDTTSPG